MKKNQNETIFTFDHDSEDMNAIEKSPLRHRLLHVLRNRYGILTVMFSIFGTIILVMTAALQFSGAVILGEEASTAVARELVVSAPRGEILDANGVKLAYSQSVNNILISYTKLTDEEFNTLLLELSYLFDQYNVTAIDNLSKYLSIEPFAFNKEEEEIILWQVNKNLFDLKEPVANVIVTAADQYYKTDPQIFFLYLRRLFKIDPGLSTEEAYRIVSLRYEIYQQNWNFLQGAPVKIATDVPEDLLVLLLEQNFKYPGILMDKDYRRTYTPLAIESSHVLGYIGNISPEEYDSLKNYGYSSEDIIGLSGVEKQMERYLHGQSGILPYNIWSKEQETGQFFQDQIGREPVAGANVSLTIDSRLQKVATDALKDFIKKAEEQKILDGKSDYKSANAGAIVAMDVRTGEILAMVSYPNFDPNNFALRLEGDEKAEEALKYYLALEDKKAQSEIDMPLWNRAILSRYAPGSTFKMVTAVAGLETGKINLGTQIVCKGHDIIGEWEWKCLEEPIVGHGALNLIGGMATSCNLYFQKLGTDMVGIDNIDKYGEKLGLGILTGVDLPGEIPGFRASRDTKKMLRKKDNIWYPADTAQTSIGQFDNSFTILQLARYTAALATNNLVTPHVVKDVIAPDGRVLYQGSTTVTPVGLNESTIYAIRESMKAVVTHPLGTAKALKDFPIPVAAKTGTAETGWENIKKEYSNGLFVCYAPADEPEIAIALVVEKGEWGSHTAEISKKILEAYFNTSSEGAQTSNPVLGDDITETTALEN